jgi:hypothetical protein
VFTTNLCTLFFGDYSGLWPADDYHRTLRETAVEYLARNRKYKLQYRLVATNDTQGSKRYTYRAEHEPAANDETAHWVEYTVSADATLQQFRRSYDRPLRQTPIGIATTDLFGFGEQVLLPSNPSKNER